MTASLFYGVPWDVISDGVSRVETVTNYRNRGTLESLFLLHFSVAFAAVNRSVVGGLEGNTSFLAALVTSGGEEFLLGLASVLALIAACLASLGLVLEALFCIEFLFTGSENEIVSAVLALQCDVLIHVCYLALRYKIFYPRADSHRHL